MISTVTKRSPRTEGGGDFAPALGGGSGAKRACSPRLVLMKDRARSGSQANRGLSLTNSDKLSLGGGSVAKRACSPRELSARGAHS